MKSSFQAKLFLFYLRFKKPIIILSAAIATVIIGLDNWQRYQYRTADYTPWKVASVDSGSSFSVTRHDENKTVNLCGVTASGDESKDFLNSVINLGDGTVTLEQVGDSYEAWILMDRDYDVKLVQHISDKPNELIEQQIHLNTWVVERGIARHDQQNSSQCSQPEHLDWAENIAKDNKLGIWKNKDSEKDGRNGSGDRRKAPICLTQF